jgi:hypothetical protein
VGFSLLVNDNDGQTTAEGNGREGWLELTPGIARRKDPYHFGELRLVDAEPTDAGAAPDAVSSDVPSRTDVAATQDVLRSSDGGDVLEDRPQSPGCGCVAGGRRRARAGAR